VAIDTPNRRRSAASNLFLNLPPIPDGSITEPDWYQLAGLYSGFFDEEEETPEYDGEVFSVPLRPLLFSVSEAGQMQAPYVIPGRYDMAVDEKRRFAVDIAPWVNAGETVTSVVCTLIRRSDGENAAALFSGSETNTGTVLASPYIEGVTLSEAYLLTWVATMSGGDVWSPRLKISGV
jgi:hypothetical protein